MRNDVKYDFLVLTEYQSCCYIDRVNGTVASSADV